MASGPAEILLSAELRFAAAVLSDYVANSANPRETLDGTGGLLAETVPLDSGVQESGASILATHVPGDVKVAETNSHMETMGLTEP